MSFNIRDYVSDDHIESIGEIATGQARIIQALTLDNSQKDKEIERLNNIINELEKDLEKSYNIYNAKDTFDNYVVSGTILYVLKKIEELKEKK